MLRRLHPSARGVTRSEAAAAFEVASDEPRRRFPFHAAADRSRARTSRRLDLDDSVASIVAAPVSGQRVAALFGDARRPTDRVELYVVLATTREGSWQVGSTDARLRRPFPR